MKHVLKQHVKRAVRLLTGKQVEVVDRYAHDASALANVYNVTGDMLRISQQHPERVRWGQELVAHWFIPAFDHPYYGGAMTILRLAAYMRTHLNVRPRFLVSGSLDCAKAKGKYVEAFPELQDCDVVHVNTQAEIDAIPFADFSFATLWTTAYLLLKINNTGLKFYLAQDYEPLFYPAGSTSAQAALTYHFGFHGIANTQSIREAIEGHGMKAIHLTPQVDPTIFHNRTEDKRSTSRPIRLFFYGRPGHPRNAFELASIGLRLAKENLGDRIDIISAGAGWDVAAYGLKDVIRPLGLLPYRETGDLYRSCHLGFVMMMTKHPSYLPFEMMACGTLVITNQNPANQWFLKDNENCLLTAPSASCIAERIIGAVNSFDALNEMRILASSDISNKFSNWDAELDKVISHIQSMGI
jgi:O-antigen biosynthesis protein